MPIIGSMEMLTTAYKNGYAVPGFDGWDASTCQNVLVVAQEKKSPALLICGTNEYATLGAKTVAAVVQAVSDVAGIPVCIHLDHARSYEQVVECIEAGYKSVMIDGSKGDYEYNVALTKKVVEYAHPRNIPVEAELGTILDVDEMTWEKSDAKKAVYTDPEQARDFVNRTGCDYLAVSIGNAHGWYPQAPVLDFETLKNIRAAVSIPLVLHGGSGTPPDQLKKAVSLGISKVNVASEINRSFNAVYLPLMQEGKTWWAEAELAGNLENRKVIAKWMDNLGSSGKQSY